MNVYERFCAIRERQATEIDTNFEDTIQNNAQTGDHGENVNKDSEFSPTVNDSQDTQETNRKAGASKTISQRMTQPLKHIPSRLVWAACENIKGGNAHICARVCDTSMTASQYVYGWPPKDDEVVIEYINPPSTFVQYRIFPSDKLIPYFRNPTRKFASDVEEEKTDAWNETGLKNMLKLFHRKFTVAQSQQICENIAETARTLLRFAFLEFVTLSHLF